MGTRQQYSQSDMLLFFCILFIGCYLLALALML
ncbi:hypothetical protein FHS90_004038 [Rufibacter quisquiliarum]|uniref:Uncharacterized protein n=1 Tax=Rufibacter quisquiliarum TaxID=1549639 RepID=A0A839GN12_9BACT|nr:hypothetical protein [Rufibacter quisquiliarum]